MAHTPARIQVAAHIMTASFQPVREWRDVSLNTFREQILPANQPALLKGAVASWPAVIEGRRSSEALAGYLQSFDAGRPVNALMGEPEIEGHFFYRDDMRGLNFTRKPEQLKTIIALLLSLVSTSHPPAVYVESTPIAEFLPRFLEQNKLELLAPTIQPRIWIGNAITVQTHFDLNDNVACVVGGRRRFTLFPPEQLPNLYVGPFDFTLSGPPVSMVSLKHPDLEKYPRFKHALAAAQVAELEPGDALYIPYFWWHHVESLSPFNVLVNYWWNEAKPQGSSPFDCLLHALMTLRDLPTSQREAWRIVFDHYVFQTTGDPMAHLAPEHRGLLGPSSKERTAAIRAILVRALSR
ncbi:MAG TPA: cupin-like domain-containing protein [Steroidobacteraceae bacterium]|nr:cupin-like domain-containing protein [Steroidobacteraceae bacterium]